MYLFEYFISFKLCGFVVLQLLEDNDQGSCSASNKEIVNKCADLKGLALSYGH